MTLSSNCSNGMASRIPMVMIAPFMLGMLGAGEQANSAQAAEDER